MLDWWAENDSFEKLRKQNAGKEPWSFLDGPITANNPMGVHHAWGRTLKDCYQRYHAMLGRELRYHAIRSPKSGRAGDGMDQAGPSQEQNAKKTET